MSICICGEHLSHRGAWRVDCPRAAEHQAYSDSLHGIRGPTPRVETVRARIKAVMDAKRSAETFDTSMVEHGVTMILTGAGEDQTREGLDDTPRRYARFLKEWMHPAPFTYTTFDAEGADEIIVQTGCLFFSLCEHHMLPFYGTATVGYLPNERIVGLSKLARTVRHCARGFQNQERITNAVANMIEQAIQPKGVGVVLRAEHLCMSLRGVQAPGTITQTSCLRGTFREDAMARAEFLDLALGRGDK